MPDQIPYLGKKIPQDETPSRDCIHIAVIPLIAGSEHLYPSQAFKLAHGTTDTAVQANKKSEIIGIIDPFLDFDHDIRKGDKIWGYLIPNTVTGMRHHWAHPAFDNVPPITNESETWIRRFCEQWNFDYGEVRHAVDSIPTKEPVKDEPISQLLTDEPLPDEDEFHEDFADHYITAYGIDLHGPGELGADLKLFWHHMGILNDRKYDKAEQDSVGWSCSC